MEAALQRKRPVACRQQASSWLTSLLVCRTLLPQEAAGHQMGHLRGIPGPVRGLRLLLKVSGCSSQQLRMTHTKIRQMA